MSNVAASLLVSALIGGGAVVSAKVIPHHMDADSNARTQIESSATATKTVSRSNEGSEHGNGLKLGLDASLKAKVNAGTKEELKNSKIENSATTVESNGELDAKESNKADLESSDKKTEERESAQEAASSSPGSPTSSSGVQVKVDADGGAEGTLPTASIHENGAASVSI